MTRSRWTKRLAAALLWLVPGMAMLGTDCAADVRGTLKTASLNAIGASWQDVLDSFLAQLTAGVQPQP